MMVLHFVGIRAQLSSASPCLLSLSGLKFRFRIPLRDVLWAIPVEGYHVDKGNPLNVSLVARIAHGGENLRVYRSGVFNTQVTENLQATTSGVQYIRSVSCPISGGRENKRLSKRVRLLRLVSWPISGGSDLMRLPERFRLSRLMSWPISGGSELS